MKRERTPAGSVLSKRAGQSLCRLNEYCTMVLGKSESLVGVTSECIFKFPCTRARFFGGIHFTSRLEASGSEPSRRGILAHAKAFKDFLCSSELLQFKPSETQRFVDEGKPASQRRKS
jgi:hypothetical protein